MTDNFSAAMSDLWRSVAVFVPKFVAFLLILLIGWFVAKAIGKAIDAILERVGFDRAVERGGVKKALAHSRYDASTIVGKLVYYALLLFVLQLAFGVFGPNPISDLIASVIGFVPKAIVAIIIIVVASAIAAAVRDLISNALGGLSYGRVLATIASVFILALGIIAALNQVGIATTVTTPILVAVLATVAGILIVGVGGGLVRPMQSRWESYLETMSRETTKYRAIRQSQSQSQSPTPYESQSEYSSEYPSQSPGTGEQSWDSGHETEARAADDFYHDRPAGESTQVIDGGYEAPR
jgi:hypothetical protein